MSEPKSAMSDEEIDNLWIVAWKELKQESYTYGPLQLEGRRAFARRLLAEFAERVAALVDERREMLRLNRDDCCDEAVEFNLKEAARIVHEAAKGADRG